jgi:iduronate 2-sulfatase
MSLFENSARVPLIIHDPRAKANGRACVRTVELVDLHATLADLCGLEAPKTDGMSLKPLLEDSTRAWDRPAFTQVTRPSPTPKDNPWFMGRTVRTERYRYTEWDDGKKGAQLYDLENDPGELKNLATDPAADKIVAELKARLKAMK